MKAKMVGFAWGQFAPIVEGLLQENKRAINIGVDERRRTVRWNDRRGFPGPDA
jgi:hypothetical protein